MEIVNLWIPYVTWTMVSLWIPYETWRVETMSLWIPYVNWRVETMSLYIPCVTWRVETPSLWIPCVSLTTTQLKGGDSESLDYLCNLKSVDDDPLESICIINYNLVEG